MEDSKTVSALPGTLDAESCGAFTPGPWVQVEASICGPDGVPVAKACRCDEFWTLSHDEFLGEQQRIDANARLIAASPELLAAAQLGAAAIRAMARTKPLTPTGDAVLETIDAAIAKALGPSPNPGRSTGEGATSSDGSAA